MSFVLESGCKGIAFFDTMQDFSKENAIFMWFLTLVYTIYGLLWAHTLFLLRASAGGREANKTNGTNGNDKANESNGSN